MPLPTTVRSYKSTDYGAPRLSGTAGDLVALLDACLINGYGQRAVQTLTRSGSTATATIAGHAHNEHDVVTIAGANETEFNGTYRIFNVTADTFDYEITGTPATPATGSVTCKKPGGGWEKAYSSGTNIAAYRSAGITSTRILLKVDDTTSTYATVKGYESMSDINTGTGAYPPSTSLYWLKSTTADTTSRAWEVVTDGFFFYCFFAHYPTYPNGHSMFQFGDIVMGRQGDAYGCLLSGSTASSTGTTPGASSQAPYCSSYYTVSVANSQMLPRNYGGVSGTALDATRMSIGYSGAGYLGVNQTQQLAYPHAVDGALVACPVLIAESTSAIRGAAPGMYNPLHDRPGTRLSVLGDFPGLPGRKLWYIPVGVNNVSNSYEGRALIDVTGPWR